MLARPISGRLSTRGLLQALPLLSWLSADSVGVRSPPMLSRLSASFWTYEIQHHCVHIHVVVSVASAVDIGRAAQLELPTVVSISNLLRHLCT